MKYRVALLIGTLLVAMTAAAAAQETQNSLPTPTPTPAQKRRAFDQFDLSSGPGIGTASRPERRAAAVSELVDKSTYDGIVKLVDFVSQTETEFRSSEGVAVKASDHFEPYRVLSRKLPALFRISEMLRSGLLDQAGLTDPSNLAILGEIQQVLTEMHMVTISTETELARNQPRLIPIAERYGAPTYPVEKRPLLSAMFTRLTGNFSRLKSQVKPKTN